MYQAIISVILKPGKSGDSPSDFRLYKFTYKGFTRFDTYESNWIKKIGTNTRQRLKLWMSRCPGDNKNRTWDTKIFIIFGQI